MMSNPIENPKKSFFDISQYSPRTRKIIFGVVAGSLVAVVFAAMFIISPLSDKEEPTTKTTTPATQAPVNPDATPAPTADPLTAEEESQQQQQAIIENSAKNLDQDAEIIDIEADIPNVDTLTQLATNGVLSYCVIAAGETTEERQIKMEPYFHSDNSTYMNPAEFYYERVCSIEATTDPEISVNGDVLIYFGVAWSAVLSAEDEAAEAGYSQYAVTVDENGIISIDD